MTRGAQKQQAQEKNAAKNAANAKKGSQLGEAAKRLTTVCPICKASMAGHKLLLQHYEAKHPKETCPAEGA